MQDAGAFGEAAAGGARYLARLLRATSTASAFPAGRLMPCPSGSLADLKFVPLDKQDPGFGEIKVTTFVIPRLYVAGTGFDIVDHSASLHNAAHCCASWLATRDQVIMLKHLQCSL